MLAKFYFAPIIIIRGDLRPTQTTHTWGLGLKPRDPGSNLGNPGFGLRAKMPVRYSAVVLVYLDEYPTEKKIVSDLLVL